MICPHCHTDNRAAAKFCNECGFDLRTLSETGETAAEIAAPAANAAAGDDALTPVEAISQALDEVKSLRDTVPPIIKVPAIGTDGAEAAPDEPAEEHVEKASASEVEAASQSAAQPAASVRPDSVSAEAQALFGPKPLTSQASSGFDQSVEVTADLTGLERLVDSSYVPPTYSGRAGDTMELPRISDDQVPASRSFMAEADRQEKRRQRKAERALKKEQAKREKELRKQGAVPVESVFGAAPADAAQVDATPADADVADVADAAGSVELPEAHAADTVDAAASDPLSGAGELRDPLADDAALATQAARAPESDAAPVGEPLARSRKRVLLIVAGVLVVAAIAAGATYALQLWGGKIVPNVVGNSQVDAQMVLEEKGFVAQVAQVKSDEIEGIVLSTEPGSGGRAEAGSTVVVNVSVARNVPSVAGVTRAEAELLMAAEGFTQVEYVYVKSNEAEGTVLAVKPEAGTRAKADTPITVEVAEPYTVPDVTGKTTEEATKLLADEGYEVQTAWYNTEDLPEGTAVSTEPAAGAKLNSGETVTLNVAHNRSTDLIEFTRAFFTEPSYILYNGKNYRVDIDSLQLTYAGDNTVNFSAQGVEVGFIFGIPVDNPSGAVPLAGTITWDDDDNIVSTSPVMKQGS